METRWTRLSERASLLDNCSTYCLGNLRLLRSLAINKYLSRNCWVVCRSEQKIWLSKDHFFIVFAQFRTSTWFVANRLLVWCTWGISLWLFAPSWRERNKYVALSMQHWSLREADLQDNSTSGSDCCALQAATIQERSTLSLVHSTRCRPWLTLVSTHSVAAAAMHIWAGGRIASRLPLANLILLQVL